MARRKRVRLTTPKGIAKWPYLTSPDTKFNPDGEYRVGLLLDPNEHTDFLQELDRLADEAFEKAKQDLIDKGKKGFAKQVVRMEPYRMELDQDGEETGMVEVRFKMKALVKTKDGRELRFSPSLFDAKGNPIDPEKVSIGGGSTIRVNYTPNPYYVAATKNAGVSLQLNAVQVIELVTYGGGNAESFGFGEEDGYVVEENDDDTFTGNEYSSSDEDEEVDF